MDKRLLTLAGLAAASGLLAALLIRPPDAGPPLDELNPRPSARAPSLARTSADASPGHAPRLVDAPVPLQPVRPRPPDPTADTDAVLALGVPERALEAPPELDPEELVEARTRRIEQSVLNVLIGVAPELDEQDIQRSCSADGRRCTFEGPWPGNDFFGRWVQAIDDGMLTREDTAGVTFRRFEPVDTQEGRIFRIVAVTDEAG